MLKNPLMEKLRSKISAEDKALIDETFDIADRIHSLLQKHGMSQKQLADKLDKRESEVSKWLSGSHNFTLSTLFKIGEAIGERVYTLRSPEELKERDTIISWIRSESYVSSIHKDIPRCTYQTKPSREDFYPLLTAKGGLNSLSPVVAFSKKATILINCDFDVEEGFEIANIRTRDFKYIEELVVQ